MKKHPITKKHARVSPYLLRPRRSLEQVQAQTREAPACGPSEPQPPEEEPEHIGNRAFGE